jgi:hypothetical protein
LLATFQSFSTEKQGLLMGPVIFLVVVVVVMTLSILGWTFVLRVQKERKISEFKINYLRIASAEENAYSRYLQAEKNYQIIEMELEKNKDIILLLKKNMIPRKRELRELIESLRIVKTRHALNPSESALLDAELEITKISGEIKTRWFINDEDKKKIIAERTRMNEKNADLPILSKEVDELNIVWDGLRKELEKIELAFLQLDKDAFKRFSESFIKKRTEEGKLDPEREIINMILLLNNKQGMLYVKKKEAAKDPTTESMQQVKKYANDIRKLESQISIKSKRMGLPPERVVELKKLFIK